MNIPLPSRVLAAVLAVEGRSPNFVLTCAELLGENPVRLMHLTRRARVASKEIDRRKALPRLRKVR